MESTQKFEPDKVLPRALSLTKVSPNRSKRPKREPHLDEESFIHIFLTYTTNFSFLVPPPPRPLDRISGVLKKVQL